MKARLERRVPLPWEHVKSCDEDARAGERIDAILRASSYVQADRDTAFLRDNATRGVRLQLDYLKTEEILRASGVERTIVVFGSTHLRESATARAELEAARRDARADPGDAALGRALRVAEHRVELSRYYDIGRELGRLVGQSGDPGLAVLTGGGPGNATEIISLSLYKQSFFNLDIGYGATIGTMMLIANLVLIVLYIVALRPGRGTNP